MEFLVNFTLNLSVSIGNSKAGECAAVRPPCSALNSPHAGVSGRQAFHWQVLADCSLFSSPGTVEKGSSDGGMGGDVNQHVSQRQ